MSRYRTEALIRVSVTMCVFFQLTIRYDLGLLPAGSCRLILHLLQGSTISG